jgi:hypothetical protein
MLEEFDHFDPGLLEIIRYAIFLPWQELTANVDAAIQVPSSVGRFSFTNLWTLGIKTVLSSSVTRRILLVRPSMACST